MRKIVKQPNGLFACWSDVIQDFIVTDLTREDYIKFRADEAYKDKEREVVDIFERLEELEKDNPDIYSNHGYCMNYEDCINIIKGNGHE